MIHIGRSVSFVVKLSLSLVIATVSCASDNNNFEITPHKLSDPNHLPEYTIPPSARHITSRQHEHESPVVYYFSKPQSTTYPIAILCTGSSNESSIFSIIHFHRYFLQEFLDMGAAVITVEQWGVDGNKINKKEFMEHYTRSQRLHDHSVVIEHLMAHPPEGWNGKFVFLGVSEGGPLVISLTERYQQHTLATINWCGAGAWNWREELWSFIEGLKKNGPWWLRSLTYASTLLRLSSCFGIPVTRVEFDKRMDEVLQKPTIEQKFMNMTHKYHADALTYPICNYAKLCAPFLVVAGAEDTIIQSCDEFVEKALNAGANITYLRVDDMDHYMRKRPDIIEQSFAWLQEHITMTHLPIAAKEFYFVRHGQTDHNIGFNFPDVDIPLNLCGRQQAAFVGSELSSLEIQTICYSPLLRAKETKNIINAQLQVEAKEVCGLAECSIEDWQDIKTLKTNGLSGKRTSIFRFVKQVSDGIITALSQESEPVLIVAHGGVYYVLCFLLNISDDDWMLNNCELAHFYIDANGRWKVHKCNYAGCD